MVLNLLWKLMRAAWKTQAILSEWCRAVTTFSPKEQDSCNINQFRGIALRNVEGKIFFFVVAKQVTNSLLENNFINTSCQKAGVPGFPSCMEHSTMILEQIQAVKRDKSDLKSLPKCDHQPQGRRGVKALVISEVVRLEGERDKSADLTAECREAGWKAVIYPVEVRCRGFIGTNPSAPREEWDCQE